MPDDEGYCWTCGDDWNACRHDEARQPTRIPGSNIPGLVTCPCGCGEQFEGYGGEPFSAECADRIRTSTSAAPDRSPE